jgi:hypothetical protein
MYKRSNGAEIAPCIISKVRYAFNQTQRPINTKKCSIEYWNEAVEVVARKYQIGRQEIDSVKNQFDFYIRYFVG